MIRKVIRQILEEAIGDFNYNKTFTPPYDVVSACKAAMAKGGSKLEKAVELSSSKPQTFQQVKKLRDFFNKNLENVNKIKAHTLQDEELMKSWNLHGGDAGKRWVDGVMAKFHDENLRTKSNLRKAGGAGEKKGMGIFDTGIMDTNKGRNNIR